jgi:hypothetical protein
MSSSSYSRKDKLLRSAINPIIHEYKEDINDGVFNINEPLQHRIIDSADSNDSVNHMFKIMDDHNLKINYFDPFNLNIIKQIEDLIKNDKLKYPPFETSRYKDKYLNKTISGLNHIKRNYNKIAYKKNEIKEALGNDRQAQDIENNIIADYLRYEFGNLAPNPKFVSYEGYLPEEDNKPTQKRKFIDYYDEQQENKKLNLEKQKGKGIRKRKSKNKWKK